MRAIVRLVACVMIAVVAASCGNPVLERKYINEGAGVDLNSGDTENQIALLNQYIAFVCLQMGPQPDCVVASQTFVQAGMNDIDLRCDGFLTWLDARRRDRAPVLAEISAVNGAVHDIMAITGSSPKSLNIVTTAFSLASATYANWNSRLLISVNQSTVQEVVYTSQGKYRERIRNFPVPDQPTAIYLLRNYLRLCMPITIEASINTSTTLVQRDLPPSVTQPLVVQNVTPPPVQARQPLGPPGRPTNAPTRSSYQRIIKNYDPNVHTIAVVDAALLKLCVTQQGLETINGDTVDLVKVYQLTTPARHPVIDGFLTDADLADLNGAPDCPRERLNFFEVTLPGALDTQNVGVLALLNAGLVFAKKPKITSATPFREVRASVLPAIQKALGAKLKLRSMFLSHQITPDEWTELGILAAQQLSQPTTPQLQPAPAQPQPAPAQPQPAPQQPPPAPQQP